MRQDDQISKHSVVKRKYFSVKFRHNFIIVLAIFPKYFQQSQLEFQLLEKLLITEVNIVKKNWVKFKNMTGTVEGKPV